MKPQQLFVGPGKLLDGDGNLTQAGWATQQELDCNLENAHFYHMKFMQGIRIKRWDYYAITTPSHFFSFTISDIGYLGMVFAYVIDFATGKYQEQTLTLPFGGGVKLPRNSYAGETISNASGKTLNFTITPDRRLVSVRWPRFGDTDLEAELEFAHTATHESMNIIIPIKGRRFYYNRKINCMPASGWVKYSGETFTINPDTCLANLDWGRGVWEYESFWVWASASGFLVDGRRIGLNMGYGFGDTTAATENCFILEGKVHKLGEVKFTYNNKDFKAPWKMVGEDGRLDLVFTPFFERVAKTDLKLLRSEVHQMFGRYNGTLVSDSGEKLQVRDVVGWAEEHQAKW